MDALGTLKALANDTRFSMLRMLHVRDLCVCEFEVALKITQSKVSYHLAVLRETKLVSVRQDGRWSVYALEPKALYHLGGMVQESLAEPIDLSHIPDCRSLEMPFSQQFELMTQANSQANKETPCAC
jgi:ArsR family transcriptional regulator, arsenate/arsenite/antimonite-responsive transcriptional repressor